MGGFGSPFFKNRVRELARRGPDAIVAELGLPALTDTPTMRLSAPYPMLSD